MLTWISPIKVHRLKITSRTGHLKRTQNFRVFQRLSLSSVVYSQRLQRHQSVVPDANRDLVFIVGYFLAVHVALIVASENVVPQTADALDFGL